MTVEEAKVYMPSTTITISDQDPFKEQNEAFAKLLQTAEVPCGVLEAFGSMHDVEIFHQARDSSTAELMMLAISGKLKAVMGLQKTSTTIRSGVRV
jgi:acetyl esterase/lipase